MKHADSWLAPVVEVDCFQDDLPVPDHGRDIVIAQATDGIPAVIPEVMDNQVEVGGKT